MTKNIKDDKNKCPWQLIELELLEGIAFIREYGNTKYQANSWKLVDNAPKRYLSALIRHISAMQREELDPESGMPHLWHILTNAYFLEYFRRKEKDEGRN